MSARNPVTGAPGTTVEVTARGFAPNERVRLTWRSTTGPVLGEMQVASNGTGSVRFQLPDAATAWVDYAAVGLTSGARAWGNFGIQPGLSLSATSASPGQSIVATARGYMASERVTFAWNRGAAGSGSTLCTITTDASGIARCAFNVPAGSGSYPVAAIGSGGATQSASLTVSGGLSASVTPSSGIVGATIQLNAGGLSASEQVTIRWDGGVVAARTTSTSSGTVAYLTTVPFLTGGSHTVTLQGQTSGRRATAGFSVSSAATITPNSGGAGTQVTVTAQGLAANQTATVWWNRSGSTGGSSVCTARTTASGTVSCTFTTPGSPSSGGVPIRVVAGSTVASLTFTASTSSTGGGSPVGPPNSGNGTYVVNATREGLVGGTTSSGYVIQPYDRFVSLPACTATSCPWLTPGGYHPQWGTRTECGSSCYVRIVNPASGACIVAPVKDTGPWFTLDDWWQPTSQRYLNTLSTNPNVLRQGYPGAQAAPDGLDVGYGRAPSGTGISNIGLRDRQQLGHRHRGRVVDRPRLQHPGRVGQQHDRDDAHGRAARIRTPPPRPAVRPRPTRRPERTTARPLPRPSSSPAPSVRPSATPSAPATAAVRMSPTTFQAGTTVSMTISDFRPNEIVALRVGPGSGTLIARYWVGPTGTLTTIARTTTFPIGTQTVRVTV